MDKKQLSKAIYEYIVANEGTSYVELEHIFESNGYDYQGDRECCPEGFENVVLWAGWSEEAFEIISGLMKSGKIERLPCQPLIYMIDGKMLTYPILKGDPKKLKRTHWLPSAFKAL